MAGQVVVRVVLGPADVTMVCDDVGYSPDVMDDMRTRAIDTLHQALHMQSCGEAHIPDEEFLARLMGEADD